MMTSAEQVAGNRYLLEEILVLLPAKTLARSKLVSKQWLSHISNPKFVQHHCRHRLNKLPTGMFVTDSKALCTNTNFVSFDSLNPTYQTIPSLGFLYNHDKVTEIHILRACNGLLLCLVTFNPCDSSDSTSKYCVCNPTTRKFRLLPSGPLSVSSDHNAYLAYDSSVSLHYKVICTRDFYSTNVNPFEIYIYSAENQCWRTFVSPFDPPREGSFLNGPIFWLCDEYSLYFNAYTEEMKRLTVPPNRRSWMCLAVDGSPMHSIGRKDSTTTDFQVLEMSKDVSEWVTKYDVCVDALLSAYPEIAVLCRGIDYEQILYSFDPVCVVEGVEEDESEIVFGIHGKLVLYSLKHKKVKELCELQGELSDQFGYGRVRVFQFVETLYAV